MLARNCFILIFVLLFLGCKKEPPQTIDNHYQFGEISVETVIPKTRYQLPEFITVQLNIKTPETNSIQVSLDKTYKKYFQLEQVQTGKTVGDLPDCVFLQHKYVLSAKKPGSFYIPGFEIEVSSAGQKKQLKTDPVLVGIFGLVDYSIPEDSVKIYPIFNKK